MIFIIVFQQTLLSVRAEEPNVTRWHEFEVEGNFFVYFLFFCIVTASIPLAFICHPAMINSNVYVDMNELIVLSSCEAKWRHQGLYVNWCKTTSSYWIRTLTA